MIICHGHKYVFVKTRKTGGTSVEIALSEFTGPYDVLTRFGAHEDNEMRRQRGADEQNQKVPLRRYRGREWRILLTQGRRQGFRSHMSATEIRRLTPRHLWSDYFTFTIARNPWETAASAYAWEMRFGPGSSFSEFLRSRTIMWHNWPIYTAEDKVIVDQIIRHENLAIELGGLTARLGLSELDLPRAKSGLRRGPYQDLFDAEDRRFVAEVCAQEIEYFGWSFG